MKGIETIRPPEPDSGGRIETAPRAAQLVERSADVGVERGIHGAHGGGSAEGAAQAAEALSGGTGAGKGNAMGAGDEALQRGRGVGEPAGPAIHA